MEGSRSSNSVTQPLLLPIEDERLAGDLAEADEGEIAMTATDLVGRLGDAVLELTARRKIKPEPGG